MAVSVAYALHEFEFILKADGTNLEFHAVESLVEFLVEPLGHLFEIAHPYQSVDGDSLFSPAEWGVEDDVTRLQMEHGGFQSEEHRWIVAQEFWVETSRLFYLVAEAAQQLGVV